jgi:hypothetical protein
LVDTGFEGLGAKEGFREGEWGVRSRGVLGRERQGIRATVFGSQGVLRREGGFGEKGGILGRERWMFGRKGTFLKGEWGV